MSNEWNSKSGQDLRGAVTSLLSALRELERSQAVAESRKHLVLVTEGFKPQRGMPKAGRSHNAPPRPK